MLALRPNANLNPNADPKPNAWEYTGKFWKKKK